MHVTQGHYLGLRVAYRDHFRQHLLLGLWWTAIGRSATEVRENADYLITHG